MRIMIQGGAVVLACTLGGAAGCECDGDPACNIFDSLCFQDSFTNGCP